MPYRVPEDMPEDMPDRVPEDMPEDMPDRVPEDMPEHVPNRMPEDMPDKLPEGMPDKMPEDMPDRMPEDLPVTKHINVLVGITRSKVICICVPVYLVHVIAFIVTTSACLCMLHCSRPIGPFAFLSLPRYC